MQHVIHRSQHDLSTLELGYGLKPLLIERPPNLLEVLRAGFLPRLTALRRTVQEALRCPLASRPLADLAAKARRIALVVPHGTRVCPRREMVEAVLEELGPGAQDRAFLLVATAQHLAHGVEELGLGQPLLERLPVLFHNARDPAGLVQVGQTRRGTLVEVSRAYHEADLKIALGSISPHYFAGYGGGAKLIFPGLAGEEGIWQNHALKNLPGSRLGVVDGNPCRADMEEAALMAGLDFLCDVVSREDGQACGVVAGHPLLAHRAGVALAKRACEVKARGQADLVITSDGPALAANLYQASQLIPPAARLLKEGGVIVLAAACYQGLGPVELINRGIYQAGLVPLLPLNHTIFLVSSLDRETVASSYCLYVSSVPEALAKAARIMGRTPVVSVLPRAGSVVPTLP